jgi:hypothetical protein
MESYFLRNMLPCGPESTNVWEKLAAFIIRDGVSQTRKQLEAVSYVLKTGARCSPEKSEVFEPTKQRYFVWEQDTTVRARSVNVLPLQSTSWRQP